ncbi:MAG: M43 family zinc metalloprotease [Ignavibacteria bacterium]
MRKLFSFITFTLILSFSYTVLPQSDGSNNIPDKRECSTMDVFDRLKSEDPNYENRLREIEEQIQEYIKNNGQDHVVVTIPVVVHVVYKTSAQNISDAQVQTQLNVLNEDFRKLNADRNLVPAPFQPLHADCEINFCLAVRDPNGNPTNGITRTQTTKKSFRTNDDVKFTSRGGKDAWPRDSYLNIWVCDLFRGYLGYAQFPGGNAATDGIVVDYKAFGTIGTATYPFNKGRTATHEVGHWLNLRHIWGDDGTSCLGTDFVSDTPNQADENYGCPPFPSISCSNGPNGDMWMDYMDYTDDRCMYMFSNGQSSRMNAILNGTRISLLTSNGCVPVNAPGIQLTMNNFILEQNYPNPFNPVTVIHFSLPGNTNVTLNIYDVTGRLIRTLINGEIRSAGRNSVEFDGSDLSSGIYIYRLEADSFVEIKKMLLIK